MAYDSGTGRTSYDVLTREIAQLKADVRRLDRHSHPDDAHRKRGGGDCGCCVLTCGTNITTGNMGTGGVPELVTLDQLYSEGSGLTITAEAAGHKLVVDLPGVYVAHHWFDFGYSASATVTPIIELRASAAYATTATWTPSPAPSGSGALADAISLAYPYVNGDEIQVAAGFQSSDGGATADSGGFLTVFRLCGCQGGVAG